MRAPGKRGPLSTRNRPGGDNAEALRNAAAAIGSRQLLAAQLRTGQHNLSGDELMARVYELRAERYL